MKKIAIIVCLLASSQALACPDLTGRYMFSSSSTLDVTQDRDPDTGMTTYNFTTTDEACEKCTHTKIYRADGKVTKKYFVDNIRVESTKAYCSDGVLHVRMKADTYYKGDHIATFTDNYDFSLNERQGLVEEEIKDGYVYRSSTHYRLVELPSAD
ncbi:hypothetical protein [Bdellovibrio sp. HCB337]|uniref:hypothetical protein n=1 Tax=Bdellovibrio sp. HCB337 TaxID=3394358 RepID=UPI0039A76D7B